MLIKKRKKMTEKMGFIFIRFYSDFFFVVVETDKMTAQQNVISMLFFNSLKIKKNYAVHNVNLCRKEIVTR